MNHKRGPWSQQEDQHLVTLVHTQGPLNWVKISSMLGTRTPKQCRERYHQNLKPTLNHDPITPEEGAQIEQLVHEIGKRWAEIARRLHGRSDNAVKNWWNGSQNRRKRNDRRKTAHQVHYGYEERAADMEHHYAARPGMSMNNMADVNMHMAVPRTMPMASSSSRLPLPPAPLQAGSLHEGHYCIETPLSSPSVYSPQSELAPSFVSDCGSHYSTSPQCYNVRPNLELPPLKLASTGDHASPRSSHSPTETKLPPISAMSLAPGPVSTPYSTSPESVIGNPDSYHRRTAPLASPADYFSPRPYLPTAPSSPSSTLHLRPIGACREQQPRTEERITRPVLNVADLLHK